MNGIDAVQDILVAWHQRWPALRYAELFASTEERPCLPLRTVLCLELAAARFALSDMTVATGKLNYWAEEFERARMGAAQHPLCAALNGGIRNSDAPRLWLRSLEQRSESIVAMRNAHARVAAAMMLAFDADELDALVIRITVAAYAALAAVEELPLADVPLDCLAACEGDRVRAARVSAERMHQILAGEWRTLSRQRFLRRRGLRVLGSEGLRVLRALGERGSKPAAGAGDAVRAWWSVVGLR